MNVVKNYLIGPNVLQYIWKVMLQVAQSRYHLVVNTEPLDKVYEPLTITTYLSATYHGSCIRFQFG